MLKDKTLADEQRQELEMHADKLAGIVLSAWLPYGLFRKLLTHSHCFQIVPLALLIFYKDGMHYITHQDDTCRHAFADELKKEVQSSILTPDGCVKVTLVDIEDALYHPEELRKRLKYD